MTIASALTSLNQDIQNARTVITNKGGIVTTNGGSSQLANDIATIPSGGTPTLITKSITSNGTYNASSDNADGYSSVTVNVSGGSSGTDVPLTRISDDNGNEIGTWYMNFEDANGNVFKVVLLDAQYRLASAQWCSKGSTVTDMPLYSNNYSAWWYNNAKETATTNTQLILDFCTAGGYTSNACSHCRSKSFTINGTTYYGQLPNMREVFDMWRHRAGIESMDTSASTSTSTNFSSGRRIWSSSQYSSANGWNLNTSGNVGNVSKTGDYFACPVLEIPL